jgi:2-amino-4-hydroxy-6-hydroxymethyldihydropteridine diphosphokinase
MVRCFIGLGSNLEYPGQQVTTAIAEIALLSSSKLLSKSSLYASKPLGPPDQPDFINAVIEFETSLPALTLLSHMQAIESQHQRVRKEHWGPRTLDLDLLLYGQEKIMLTELQVPHPEMTKRNFVLYPLMEIAPALIIPGLGNIEDLIAKLDDSGLQKLDQDG